MLHRPGVTGRGLLALLTRLLAVSERLPLTRHRLRESANKLHVLRCFEDPVSVLGHREAEAADEGSLAELVAAAYRDRPEDAVWITEGLACLVADRRGPASGAATDRSLVADLPPPALVPAHAGLGLSIAWRHLRGLVAERSPDAARKCLERIVDEYLEAVVAHDPKRLPLSADVKYTENSQVVALGDGFWKTAQGIGNYKHYFADPEFGQVAFMGTMREADTLLLFSLRLRIELGRITEIESVYFRPGGGGPALFPSRRAEGAHEVIVNAPQPVSSLADLDPAQVEVEAQPGGSGGHQLEDSAVSAVVVGHCGCPHQRQRADPGRRELRRGPEIAGFDPARQGPVFAQPVGDAALAVATLAGSSSVSPRELLQLVELGRGPRGLHRPASSEDEDLADPGGRPNRPARNHDDQSRWPR